MRLPFARVNPLEDDEVDRAEVEVWQHTQLTATNRVNACPRKSFRNQHVCSFQGAGSRESNLPAFFIITGAV